MCLRVNSYECSATLYNDLLLIFVMLNGRKTLVVKYIDLDREILPKKLGREEGNANKDMNVKWAIYRSLVANNLF